MRQSILDNLHQGHLGIVKTQLRAKQDVYWPAINADIERICRECPQCQEMQKAQPPEPLRPSDIPTRPWSILGADLFTIDRQNYLLLADYFSKYPIVEPLPEPCKSSHIASLVGKYCGLFGKPDALHSDNGPHFVGQSFQAMLQEWGIKHQTSSPHHPSSNGFVERMVGTVKPLMRKAVAAKQDVNLALLRLRTTPVSSRIESPAEIIFGRAIKDTLPSSRRYDGGDTIDQLEERQRRTKLDHDKGTRHLPPLYNGQTVNVRHPQTGRWHPGTVSEQLDPGSYRVTTGENGPEVRRHRTDIRPRQTKHTDASPDSTPPAQTPDMTHPGMQLPTDNTQPSSVTQAPTGTITRSGRRVQAPQKLSL